MNEYKKIKTKEQFIELLVNLAGGDNSNWENVKTSDFLEALARWLEDADGYYKNMGLDTNPSSPSWQLFSDAIQAAIMYE